MRIAIALISLCNTSKGLVSILIYCTPRLRKPYFLLSQLAFDGTETGYDFHFSSVDLAFARVARSGEARRGPQDRRAR